MYGYHSIIELPIINNLKISKILKILNIETIQKVSLSLEMALLKVNIFSNI